MSSIAFAKLALLVFLSFGFIVCKTKIVLASGFSPPVNANMGCTQIGEPFLFDGTSASCGFMAYSSLMGTPTIPAAQLQSDWNEANTGLLDYIKNKPSIPSAQVNSDWNASSGVAQILNKPNIPVVQAYENTTQRLNPILINKTVAAAGGAGNAAFNLTSDGTSAGAALCPNGVMLNSPNIAVNDATAPYQFSWAWSNSNKTMNVLAQKASGLAVLTFTLLGIPAPVPNGTNVNATVICY